MVAEIINTMASLYDYLNLVASGLVELDKLKKSDVVRKSGIVEAHLKGLIEMNKELNAKMSKAKNDIDKIDNPKPESKKIKKVDDDIKNPEIND